MRNRAGKSSCHFRPSDSSHSRTRKTRAKANSRKCAAGASHRSGVSRQGGVRERIWRQRCEYEGARGRRHCLSARVGFQIDWLNDGCRAGRRRKNCMGLEAQNARSGIRNVRSVGNARNHDPRHVRASQRLARARRRLARRPGIFACGNFASSALSTSRKQFSFALRLHEFWPDRSGGGGGEGVHVGLGRCVQAKTLHAAWHGFNEFALRRFCRTHEQSVGACDGGREMGAKVQTRSRRAIARGRREFFCERCGQVDALAAREWKIWRQTNR